MLIGERIKNIRKEHGITLQELATKTGLSVAFLSNLERDATSPTLINLQRICAALNVNITSLLSESDGSPVVRKNGRREIFNLHARVKYESMVNGTPSMRGVCMTIAEDYFGEEVSWGHNTDEFGVVITGVLHLVLEDTVYILEEGDSIYIPKQTMHRFKKLSKGPCVSYWVLSGAEGQAQESSGEG